MVLGQDLSQLGGRIVAIFYHKVDRKSCWKIAVKLPESCRKIATELPQNCHKITTKLLGKFLQERKVFLICFSKCFFGPKNWQVEISIE